MNTLAPIAILRTGTFTDVHGTKVTFSKRDLQEVVASYDAASDPAPIVLGHPTLTAPAYGWIGHLTYSGDLLFAHPSKVSSDFIDAVDAGHFRKVSPQLYPPASPANPKPGRWYLQHVGFLGASAPAIKGLGTVTFTAPATGSVITLNTASVSKIGVILPMEAGAQARAQLETLVPDRAKAIQAAQPGISFMEARSKARAEAKMQERAILLTDGDDEVAAARARVILGATRLMNNHPTMTQGAAMSAALRADTIIGLKKRNLP